jgi:hypothetical protein
MSHIKFPKISSFRKAQQSALRLGLLDPIEYVGSVKLHGTNAAVVRLEDGTLQFQSRRRVITPDDDNYGFATWASNRTWAGVAPGIAIYGEWCGPGVMNATAVNQMDRKRFVIFDILNLKDGVRILPFPEGTVRSDADVLRITEAPTPKVMVNFGTGIIDEVLELTASTGDQCPFAALFKHEGIGEGYVWRPTALRYTNNTDLWFKTKSDEYTSRLGEKPPKKPKPGAKEAYAKAHALVTERRCEQGIEYLNEFNLPLSKESTGEFIKFVIRDIEEEEDVSKDVLRAIGKFAAPWYFKHLKETG